MEKQEYECEHSYPIPNSNNMLICKLTNTKCVCCGIEAGKIGFVLNFNVNYCPGKILYKSKGE